MNADCLDKKLLKNEDGFVLVLALFTMLILTVIGISATTKTALELQVSTSDRVYNRTFYQADAGVQYVLASIRADLQDPANPAEIEDIDPSSYPVPAGFSFQIAAPDYSTIGVGQDFWFTVTGTGQGNSETSITVTFQVDAPPKPAFGLGIITDGNLNINGAPYIDGGMHANGNIDQNGAGIINGTVTAAGTVSVGSATSSPPQGGVDPIEVPFITEDIFNDLRTRAQTSPNTYIDNSGSNGKGKPGSGSHDFSTSGDLGGAIIFVDGDVTISGDIQNGSIIATGNITVNGSSQLTAGQIGVAMAAGGNITMNGASDSYGLFWSNGSFVQNGASTVHGSIVSTGNITRNGAFNFEFDGIGDFDFLPTEPPRPNVTSWIEG